MVLSVLSFQCLLYWDVCYCFPQILQRKQRKSFSVINFSPSAEYSSLLACFLFPFLSPNTLCNTSRLAFQLWELEPLRCYYLCKTRSIPRKWIENPKTSRRLTKKARRRPTITKKFRRYHNVARRFQLRLPNIFERSLELFSQNLTLVLWNIYFRPVSCSSRINWAKDFRQRICFKRVGKLNRNVYFMNHDKLR